MEKRQIIETTKEKLLPKNQYLWYQSKTLSFDYNT